jgi:hypothetical protein
MPDGCVRIAGVVTNLSHCLVKCAHYSLQEAKKRSCAARGTADRAANMIKRLRGSVDFSSRLRVAREAVYEGWRRFVHVCSDHRVLSL